MFEFKKRRETSISTNSSEPTIQLSDIRDFTPPTPVHLFLKDNPNQTEGYCLTVMKKNPFELQYVEHQTEAICEMAVSHGDVLEMVNHQTETICLKAIQYEPKAILKVHQPTHEMWLEAIKGNVHLFTLMPKQTEEAGLLAISIDSLMFREIKKQTPRLCLEAVKRDGTLIKYVKHQTDEICLAALDQTVDAIHGIKRKMKYYDIAIEKDYRVVGYLKNPPKYLLRKALLSADQTIEKNTLN